MINQCLDRSFLLRLLAAWLTCTLVVYLFASPIVKFLLPAIAFVAGLIQQDAIALLNIKDQVSSDLLGVGDLVIRPFLLDSIHLSGALAMRGHSWLPSSFVDSNHILVPAVIAITVSLALPTASLKDGFKSTLVTLTAAVLLVVITSGILIAGKVQIVIAEGYLQAGLPAPQSPLIWTVIVMESGGTWLLSIVVGLSMYWFMSHRWPQSLRQHREGVLAKKFPAAEANRAL